MTIPTASDAEPSAPVVSTPVANTPVAGTPVASAPVANTPVASNAVRLFLLDDHEIVRRGLIDLLSDEPDFFVVGESGQALGAAAAIIASKATVAILDGRLPDGSGIDVCRDVKSAAPHIRCLILTSYDDDEAVLAAVLAGADGYLLKEVRTANLIERIKDAVAGKNLMDSAVTKRVLDRVQARTASAPVAALTARETEILNLIAAGMSNREIGGTLFLAEKTVKNYVSGILSKLGMQRRTQAAVYGAQLINRQQATS